MIINEALNRVTSRRIERRFLPSVRAASENANRKRIQDLSLEVTSVRSWGRRDDRDIFFKSTNYLFEMNLSGNRALIIFFFFVSTSERVNFKRGARASAKYCEYRGDICENI